MRLVSALRPPVLLLLICVAVAGAGWSCAQGDDVDPFSRETLYLSSVCFDEESQGLVGNLERLQNGGWTNLKVDHWVPAGEGNFMGMDSTVEWPPSSGRYLVGGNFAFVLGGILYKNLLCYDTAANSLCSPGWLPSSMLPDDGPVNDMWVYEPEGNEEHHLPVLFFGGQFTKMTDGSQCNGLIRVLWENNENVVSCVSNGLTFDSVQQSPGAGISFVIADSGSSFWVGGSFSYTTKSGDVIQNIAYFDGVNFVPVGSNDFPPVTASELHVSATSSIFFATASTNAAIVYLATRAEDNNGPISARALGTFLANKSGKPLIRSLTLQGDLSTFPGYLVAGGAFDSVDSTTLNGGLATMTVALMSKSDTLDWHSPAGGPVSGTVFHITRSSLNPDVLYLAGKDLTMSNNSPASAIIAYNENDRGDVIQPFTTPSSTPSSSWADSCYSRFAFPVPSDSPSPDEEVGNATAAAMAAIFGTAGIFTVVFFSLVLGWRRLGPVDPPL